MKKRFLALLLAVCIGVSVLVLPASAAGSNTAVQTAVTLGAFSTEEAAGLSTPLTRGQLAKLLVAFSAYHDNANTQGSIGTLYTDVNGSSAYAPYILSLIHISISSGNLLVRTVTIAVPNNGSLTTAQAASASINGVSALASARFDYQHQQTVTATTSGTVSAVCVKEGTAVAANTAIVQLSGTELSRQVQSAADSLLNAQLSMSDTEKQMENYTITSPISGTVIQKNVKAGDTVGTDTASSETLCTIYDLSYQEMTLNVDELEILSIKEGQTVTITADAISDRTFTGVVTSVSAAGTTTGGTTTYPVTIRIDDTGDLLPGMNATAEIEVSSAENAPTIPNGAVVRGNYVLVTKDSPSAVNAVQDMTAPDGYVYVKITTGTSDNDSIEVTGGLQEGDTIAYDANAAEKQNASDSMEFMVGPGGTIAYDADAAEKQNASGSGGPGGGNGGPGGGGPGGGF